MTGWMGEATLSPKAEAEIFCLVLVRSLIFFLPLTFGDAVSFYRLGI